MPQAAVLLSLLGVACGNYSNVDVDFQLAVPARDDLTAKLPQALVGADAAEYYRATREVVTGFNGFVDGITGLIDHVRSFPPSQRYENGRVWGPFPAERDRNFELRMLMDRKPNPGGPGNRFEYTIAFHRVSDTTGEWHPLIFGHFDPGAGVRRGRGEVTVDLTAARVQGYPVNEWQELQRVDVTYQRLEFPHTVQMVLTNVPAAPNPGATSSYSEDADGSGQMLFVWRVRDNVWVQAIGIRSRWLASGAGRADARVTEGLAAMGAGSVGVDCWGPDAVATYSRRDFAPRREDGDPASCVFPELAP